jgi:hypothetical protein
MLKSLQATDSPLSNTKQLDILKWIFKDGSLDTFDKIKKNKSISLRPKKIEILQINVVTCATKFVHIVMLMLVLIVKKSLWKRCSKFRCIKTTG